MNKILIWPLLLCTFGIYLSTVSHTITPNGDSGELVTVAYFAGIAHPPGYPLYILLGHLFLKLPIAGEVAFRLNLFSTILHTVALYVFYRTCLLLSDNKYLLSILATSILAFSYSFWLYSLVAEVFALHDLFFIFLIYFLIKLVKSRVKNQIVKTAKWWCFLFGLSMTNNHLVVILFPIFIYILVHKNIQFQIYRGWMSKLSITCVLTGLYFLGLTPYSSLFWTKSNVNVITWFYPTDVLDVVKHFLRLTYGGFLNYHDVGLVNPVLGSFQLNFVAFFLNLYSDLWIISFLLIPAFIFLFFNRKNLLHRAFIYISVTFFIFVLMLRFDLWTYTFNIIERIVISFDMILILILFMFLCFLRKKINNILYTRLFYTVLIFISLCNVYINYRRNNLTDNTICRDYYQDAKESVKEGSIVFIDGDIQTFCFTYYEYVSRSSNKSRKTIYVFANAFREKNNGRFLKVYYNFDVKKFANGFEVAEKYLGKRDIYIADFAQQVPFAYQPIGFYKKILTKQENSQIKMGNVYKDNKKWFKDSSFMSSYNPDYMNLASQSMKEYYCMKYLSIVDYFDTRREKSLAKKTFHDLNSYCSISDFSLHNLFNAYNAFKVKFN